MIIVMFCLTWQADNGGLFIGGAYGKTIFSKSLSPSKTNEGVLGACFLCWLSALGMWMTSQ